MKKFLKYYENPTEKDMNFGLINKEYDDSIIDYIEDCCKSLEVLQYIEFLGYDYVDDESKINTSEYIESKSRSKTNKREVVKYMNVAESRCAELRLKFRLTCDGEVKEIVKKLLVPIPDENMYYTIKGTRYMLMYQIVDASTYKTKNCLVLKSMMPISIRRKNKVIKSIDGTTYDTHIYSMGLFKKDVNVILLYLAKMGMSLSLNFLSLDRLFEFNSEPDGNEDQLVFTVNSKLYLKVNKRFFEKYDYVRSCVAMFLDVMTNRMSVDDIYERKMWINMLGALGTTNVNKQYEKGINTLIYLNRVIDNTTKKVLKTHPVHKQNIYTILLWMVMNYDELVKKDNLNIENKRLRCNEYIASLLTKVFSDKVNRILALGSKVTMGHLLEMFKFTGEVLIKALHQSSLLRFDDRVNDLDFFTKLKATAKGPNSLGGNNENKISMRYRDLHPSMIGRIDVNVCGSSDPGTTSTLTPYCETSGLYFTDTREPELFKYNFDKEAYSDESSDMYTINPSYDDSDSYYDFGLSVIDYYDRDEVRKEPLFVEEPEEVEEDVETESEEEIEDGDEQETEIDNE